MRVKMRRHGAQYHFPVFKKIYSSRQSNWIFLIEQMRRRGKEEKGKGEKEEERRRRKEGGRKEEEREERG